MSLAVFARRRCGGNRGRRRPLLASQLWPVDFRLIFAYRVNSFGPQELPAKMAGASFPSAVSERTRAASSLSRTATGVPVREQLEGLAASVGPLRRVLAAIAARWVTTRAFERLGYARASDCARERAGLSARQVQELARVDRAFASLPALERALVSNSLPWSKVRLLVRVATEADADDWIARARSVSTRRLEREVRSAVRCGDGEEDELDENESRRRVAVRCAPPVREKWSVVREMAERVAGEHLRGGEVLELVAAEAFSAVPIDPALSGDTERCESPGTRRAEAEAAPGRKELLSIRARARSLPHAVASLVSGLEEADAFELDRRLRRAVRLEQTLDAAIAPLLRVVSSAEYEWDDQYRTLSAYARDELGMSSRKARALLRLERAGDVCPELREAYRSGQLSWVKAQCLLPLLLLDIEGDWRSAWVEWAERVTVRRLVADVERALLLRAGHHLAWQRCRRHPERAQDAIPPSERQMCAPDVDPEATQELAWRVPTDVALLFSAVRETWRVRLGARRRSVSDGEVFESLLDHALQTWTLSEPGARRPDPVFERDGYRCAVPGCTSRRNLHDHHIVFRSAGGSDAAGNRLSLCAFHHQRGVHGGLLRVRGNAPHGLLFELGVRSGGPPLARYRSGDIAVP